MDTYFLSRSNYIMQQMLQNTPCLEVSEKWQISDLVGTDSH